MIRFLLVTAVACAALDAQSKNAQPNWMPASGAYEHFRYGDGQAIEQIQPQPAELPLRFQFPAAPAPTRKVCAIENRPGVFWFTPDGKPILNYDVDMERVMHLVVVRDDFATFAHLHPDYDAATGTFWQDFTKDPNHRYYVYADSTPQGYGEQVFRFTLQSSGPVAPSAPALAVSPKTVTVGPYTVALSKAALPANRPKSTLP